ncbi:uncharacterized protein [Pyrus communis]|uniref:uncharacterized protein n=1 Tax=Pyrus communis TaxID=23211 RepID=UPI0035BEF339
MADHSLVLGQNGDLPLRQNSHPGQGLNHNLVPGQSHGLALRHAPDQDLELGHGSHDDKQGFRHPHDHALAFDQTNEHEIALQHRRIQNLEEEGLELEQDIGVETDQENVDVDENDNELALTVATHELGLSDNHALSSVEGHDLHENLDLAMDQNQEMGIVPDSDMNLQQSQLLDTPPVLQYRSHAMTTNHQLAVGQEFPDVHSCRRALRDAAIALRFEMQTVKSDKTRFTAKCATEGCAWRIHAAKLPGVPTFTIRTIHEEHTCGGITHLGHQQASVQWVAESVEQRLRENPNYKPKEILEEIHRVHGIALSYKQAWRGKERLMAAVRGSFEEDYRLLPQYCDQIRRTNPGSIAQVYGSPDDSSFQRLFVSLHASIYGFLNACRPLLGLDRTHLKSKYLGTLLFATGFDGDGALFPLAFGVVDEENDENWMWFLSELRVLLENYAEYMPRLTILSDRQKGIVDGVELNFPTAFHGFCMRYLSDSLRKEFNNPLLVNLLWEAAYALTGIGFEQKLIEIEAISQEAAHWIKQISPRLWATAYFEGTRFGQLTANMVESINSWIVEASGLPIIQMMECIRRHLMTWFNERREMSMQWTSILVPSAEKCVLDAVALARTYNVIRANEAEFEVRTHEGSVTVDIRTRCCSCRGWQLCGLPCSHAAAALESCRQHVYRFTESCFTVANYRKAYSETIHPIPDRTLWKEMAGFPNEGNPDMWMVINPPKSLRPPGRPRKRRIRTEDGSRTKRVVHCSRCNQTGHFRTTCAAPI